MKKILKTKLKLWQKVILGMILGMILGASFPEYSASLKPFGTVFINMIKMVVVPLIFFSILNGVTSISDASTFSRLGTRAFMIYSFTTIFAVGIGLVCATIFKPGLGMNLDLHYDPIHSSHHTSIVDMLVNIIPSNPIQSMAEGNTLQIVVFAFFTGFALILIGDKGREVKNLVISTTHLVFKMMHLVIQLTPYGVFAIMFWVIGEYGFDVMMHLGKFVLVVIGALAIQYVLFGVMLLLFARLNPLPFFKKMLTTQSLALATSSSKGTLATAISEIRSKIGVSKQTASFILPLGAAINMDATSIYLGIVSVFFAQTIGMHLTLSHYLIIILTSTIGSIGAAGFPGGSMVMMSMVLSSIGLPLEGISLIIGIDRLLEMLRTMINITGDCTVTVIVDKIEGSFDKKKYYSD